MLAGSSPSSGSTAGGTRVQITGQRLAGATQVLFGGAPGTELHVASDSELEVTTPPRADDGNASVRVLTPTGRSAGDSPVDFRYVRPPTVSRLTPATGSDGGGSVVTLVGTDLGETSEVMFGSVRAAVVTVSGERVIAVAPAQGGPGPVDVRLTTPGGTNSAGPAGSFTYTNTPVVNSLTPPSGRTDAGTAVVLRGLHLGDVTQVSFGGAAGTGLAVVSDTELRVTTPLRASTGDVAVVIQTASGGILEASQPVTFGYAAPPPAPPPPDRTWWPLGLIGLLSWSIWFVRRMLSRHAYRPVVNDFRTTTSVVVPVYREDPAVLERCLRTWLREEPTEVILVVDDQDDALLAHIRGLGLERVQVVEWWHTGKRGALAAGVRAATGEVVVFADSDTEWRPGLLAAMQMPFVDPEVGGVGSRQHVYLPHTNVWRRVAYWMLNTRYLDYVPAMSRRGGVACLSGRTAAYRREVIVPLLPALEHELFLGRECVAGDDGRLTWLTLASGYRTVHQDAAQADSMFPADLRAFLRQRIRWSRNSYRCYLTALSHGWLWRQPFITQVTVLQVLLTPVSMGAAVWYGAFWVIGGGWLAVAVVLGWAVVGRALRATSHLLENPREVVLTPLVALVVVAIALPIKFWAALTMNRQGWLTRQAGQRVQGQAEIEGVARVGQA
ncbi:MAG TPA: IPT/TIG domain-containing protein [Modestobacter sp.]|nr:IPT/TIG domain-containing protein [Modestobacter sp.]